MFVVTAKNGDTIKWDNGHFESNNPELIKYLMERAAWHYKWNQCYELDGSGLSPIEHPETNQFTAIALIQSNVPIKAVEGEVPTADLLWGPLPEGAIP